MPAINNNNMHECVCVCAQEKSAWTKYIISVAITRRDAVVL